MCFSCENGEISLRSMGQDENGVRDRFPNNFILYCGIDLLIVYLLPYSVSHNFCLFEVVIPVMWKLPIREKNHTNLIYIKH